VKRVYGSHGLSDRQKAEIEREAKETAGRFRAELKRLDKALRRGSRDEGGERGLSVNQLRDLLDADATAAAERAALAWLRAPSSLSATWCRTAFAKLGNGWIDLDALSAEARANRAKGNGRLEAVAKRMVQGHMVKTRSPK
jgi:hypothetical protein